MRGPEADWNGGAWTCTEPPGHDGPYEAGDVDGSILFAWPRYDLDAALVPPGPYSLPAIGLPSDDDAEPYCATCDAFIGMFIGMDGWHHFRGDPSPGGQRELYDTAHEPAVAWRPVPVAPISGGAW